MRNRVFIRGFTRDDVQKIILEIERQQRDRRDAVLPTTSIKFIPEYKQSGIKLTVQTSAGVPELVQPMDLTGTAEQQFAQHVGIPKRSGLYKRFLQGIKDRPEFYNSIWSNIYNEVLTGEPRRRLIRTMTCPDTNERYVRAFLSDIYAVIDAADIFSATADALEEVAAEIWHARLTDDYFTLYAVAPGITAQVERGMPGVDDRFKGDRYDVINAAVRIRSSDTGKGKIEVAPAILSTISRSYTITEDVLTRRHVGARLEDVKMLTPATIKAKHKTFFMELQDWIKSTFDPKKLQAYAESLAWAGRDAIDDPVVAAEALTLVYEVSEERKNSIRNKLIKGKDFTRLGLIRAVSAEAAEDAVDHHEAQQLEALGGTLMNTDMTQIAKKANVSKHKRVKEIADSVGAIT